MLLTHSQQIRKVSHIHSQFIHKTNDSFPFILQHIAFYAIILTMLLKCPVCSESLQQENRSAKCPNGHCFDYAKSGYLNLLLKQSKDHGDNLGMVKARTAFLQSDSYAFLRNALIDIVTDLKPNVLVDLGCGEGYYTKALPCDEKYGFDVSKDAIKYASKHDKTTNYSIASIFNLPLPDGCCDVAMTCFAPFAKDEIERILNDQGSFIFVIPGPRHLFELKQELYETPYENSIDELDTNLKLVASKTINETMHLDHETLMNLFEMTPYAYHTPKESIEHLNTLDSLDVTAEFIVQFYKK